MWYVDNTFFKTDYTNPYANNINVTIIGEHVIVKGYNCTTTNETYTWVCEVPQVDVVMSQEEYDALNT